MAVITFSRQVAALGDEVAATLAKELGYKFITRKDIEKTIVDLGFPENKMPRYDERKPGFFASLAKDRDEYLDYAQYALLKAAEDGNVIFIGRGAFAVFGDLPNHISIRLISDDKVRTDRLMKEFEWNEKQAKQRISESDTNRDGFHKSFFNVDLNDPTNFDMVLNTSHISEEVASYVIKSLVEKKITAQCEADGKVKLHELVVAQQLVNKLVFEYKIKIDFLHATIEGKTLTIQGVADSIAIVEQALNIASRELPDYSVKSAVSIVHNFKNY